MYILEGPDKEFGFYFEYEEKTLSFGKRLFWQQQR